MHTFIRRIGDDWVVCVLDYSRGGRMDLYWGVSKIDALYVYDYSDIELGG